MKVIIAGSRTITDMTHINDAVALSGFRVTEVIGGKARGVDELGEQWATYLDILFTGFPADWNKHGKRAGYLRNEQMADYAAPDGGLIAVWDGISRGTMHMIDIAHKKGLKVYVHTVMPVTDLMTGVVDTSCPTANMYGCQPCPRCGDIHRYVHSDLRQHVTCDNCKFIEPITEERF